MNYLLMGLVHILAVLVTIIIVISYLTRAILRNIFLLIFSIAKDLLSLGGYNE